jgi:hypothetical protein
MRSGFSCLSLSSSWITGIQHQSAPEGYFTEIKVSSSQALGLVSLILELRRLRLRQQDSELEARLDYIEGLGL